MMKNKRGWIKIIEAFTAILIIMSILIIVVDKGYTGKKDISGNVYEIELTILESVAIDNNLKNEILDVNYNPSGSENSITPMTEEKIEEGIPNYLECIPRICDISWICEMMNPYDKETYAQSIILIDTNTKIERRLKLFCKIK